SMQKLHSHDEESAHMASCIFPYKREDLKPSQDGWLPPEIRTLTFLITSEVRVVAGSLIGRGSFLIRFRVKVTYANS
ncbi:hypothetical protein L9F63_015002, partial [Diploptera punctata]